MSAMMIALVVGGVWAALIDGAVHVFLHGQLRPPWSYLFGVGTVITCVGLTLGWATSDWSFLALSWAAFAIPGATVCGLYYLDARAAAPTEDR
jgi:hypothetical protein